MKCSEKIKLLRRQLGFNQQELADLTGVSKRSVAAYETDGVLPRPSTLRRLAAALRCSEDYLMNDDITDPSYSSPGSGRDGEPLPFFGDGASEEAGILLEKNAALFAGGSISQEAKDAFFEAVMRAYISCKEEARKKYGRRD